MECRGCGYALWSLSEPRCPECGRGYELRSYRFEPGSAAFVCPVCGHAHGGVTPHGLPTDEDRLTCEGCGQSVPVDALSVAPLTDPPVPAMGSIMPWDNRRKLGFWRAWWGTWKMAISSPGKLVRETQPESTYWASYGFAVVCWFWGMLVTWLTLIAVILVIINLAAGSSGGGGFGPELLVFGVMGVVCLAVSVLAPLVLTVLWALPAHLGLMVLEKHRGPFRHTARSINYAQAPMLIMAVPIVGYYCNSIWQIWSLVLSVLMVRQAHQTSGWKASIAVLWFPVLMILLGMALVMASIIVDVTSQTYP